MRQSPAGTAWRDSIVKAFQIWSQYAAINVGVVSDSGDPIGTEGPTRGDASFGEIRIAGLPMTTDTWPQPFRTINCPAVAGPATCSSIRPPIGINIPMTCSASRCTRLVTSWACRTTLTPLLPCSSMEFRTVLTPAPSDIAVLQQLYGVRGPDANEVDKANDTQGDATRMRFSDVSSSFDGTKPLIHYGEITAATDRDVFFFEVFLKAIAVPPHVHVESRGLSQLQFRLTIKSSNGSVLATGDNTSLHGGVVHLQIPATSNCGKYYLHIEAIGDSLNRFGSYAVIAELDGKVSVPYATYSSECTKGTPLVCFIRNGAG